MISCNKTILTKVFLSFQLLTFRSQEKQLHTTCDDNELIV